MLGCNFYTRADTSADLCARERAWALTRARPAQQCKIYMARNRPVMFKGTAKEWPAAGKWTLDFFSQDAMGDTKVTVSLDGKVCSFPIILPALPARHQPSADKLRWPCRCSSLAA